jgi:hypothetical protein
MGQLAMSPERLDAGVDPERGTGAPGLCAPRANRLADVGAAAKTNRGL